MEDDTPPIQPFAPHPPPTGPLFTFGRLPTASERAYRERERQRELRRRERRRQQRIANAVRTTLTSIQPQQPLMGSSITNIERTFAIEFTSIPRILRWLPSGFLRPGLEMTVLGLLEHPTKFYDFMNDFKDIQYVGESARYLSLAIMILRMRWAFKRLVCVAIRRSIDRRRPIPTTDPITLEPMRDPVIVYDMSTRWRYAYDPTPLIAHIRTQLSATQYGYPAPQAPRNPITNVTFTLPQLYSVYQQLGQRGKQCWQLGAYLNAGAHMSTYMRQHIVPLYRDDCIREVNEHENTTGQTSLLEFIHTTLSNMRGVNKETIYTVIDNALYYPSTRSHVYLDAWRKLYRRSLIECSSVSIDSIVLIHADETALSELAQIASQLVRCFPQFATEIKNDLEQERRREQERA